MTSPLVGGFALPVRPPRITAAWRLALLVVLLWTVAACGTLPAPTDPAPVAATVWASTTRATTPVAGGTPRVGTATSATGGTPVAATATRQVGGNRAPAIPTAPAGATGPMLLVYQGREYRSFWFRPDLRGSPDPFAGLGVPELGTPVGQTFARWQSNNLAPAGATIYSVAGQVPERMLALKTDDGAVFFRAYEQPADLPRTTVVLATVTRQGAARWTTPDGTAPPPESDELFYATLTLDVERVLQGTLVGEPRGLEIRQLLAPPGAANADQAALATGQLASFAPGDRVLLFLWAGGEPVRGGTPGAIGRWYHWTVPNRVYLVRDGRVLPSGIPADAGRPGLPLEESIAGITEAFRGVTAIDPRNPPPFERPEPLAQARPQVEVGQTLNLAQHYALARAEWVFVSGPAVPGGRYPILDRERIAALVAALDRPATIAAFLPRRTSPASAEPGVLVLTFAFGLRDSTLLEYDRAAGTLGGDDSFSRRYTLPAPPDLARLLGLD